MIRSVLALACLAAVATAHPGMSVDDTAALTMRQASGATSPSAATPPTQLAIALQGKFGDSRRRAPVRCNNHHTACICNGCETKYHYSNVATFGDTRRRRRRRPTYYSYSPTYKCRSDRRNGSWGGFGGWGGWGGWSSCNSNGDRWRSSSRYRSCNSPTAHCGGSTCPGTNRSNRSQHSNIKRNGSWGGYGGWGNWGRWSTCNSNGDRWRTRYSYRSCSGASCGGRNSCPGSNRRSNSAHSNIKTHCARHNWGGWSACTATCGTGVQHRYRGVRVWNSCGGNGCPTGSQSQSCNTQKCPVDCKVAYWGGYNACSKSCGGGSQRRTRQLTQPKYGGKGCPTHYQNRACGQGPCAVHCTVSAFSAWTGCTKSCGKGSQSRSRAIRTRADHGGYVCPYLRETRSCNKQACAVDCVFGSFRAWSTCTKSCGTGSQERSRSIKQPTFGGKVCPHSAETRACNTAACAINCKFGDFSKWAVCTLSCGTGSQKRSRATTEPQNGGKACQIGRASCRERV